MTPATYGRLAGALFAVEALFPIIHRAVGAQYTGFGHVHTVVIDTGLAAIWIASAFAGFVQRPSQAFWVMMVGAHVTLIHFFMFSVSTSFHGPYGVGLPWLFAYPLQLFWIVRSAPAFFAHRELAPEATPTRTRWAKHAPGT